MSALNVSAAVRARSRLRESLSSKRPGGIIPE